MWPVLKVAVQFPLRRARHWRWLGFWLGLGLCLLLDRRMLLAQPQPQRLPPPPQVEPALDTPAGAALLLDGAIPLPATALEADQPATGKVEARTETVVGREMILEPKETPQGSAPFDANQPPAVPVVLMERTSGRRIIISPNQEIRIEDPRLGTAPEPTSPPPNPPQAVSEERLLYPLPRPAPITSGFGMRIHPIRGQPEFHAGVDLGASMGTPILAAFSGRVVTAGSLGGLGIAVVLEHRGNQRTRYGHLSEVAVTVGEEVQQGSVIGYVGASGEATGPHLHFELWKRTPGQGWVVLDATDALKLALAQLPG